MRPPVAASAPPRDHALDRLRGAALVAMLVHHLTGWLTGVDARDVLPGWPEFAVTDVAAPAFFVAAGMSVALFVASRRRRGLSSGRIVAQIVRRYGLLVPLGIGLRWALGRAPLGFGVLEALGVAVVAAAALAAVVPGRLRWIVAVAALAAGMVSTRWVTPGDPSLVAEVVGGKFPVVIYVGFVLVGIAAVAGGAYTDRRWVATATLLSLGAAIALLADGIVPARYPGELPFVVPGLAGTVLVYAVSQQRWPAWAAPVDRLLRPAAAHTLGIFLAHYVLFEALRNEGVNGSIEPAVAVPMAVAVTVAFCLAAPLIPPLPWSPRTGRLRRPVDGTARRTRMSRTRNRCASRRGPSPAPPVSAGAGATPSVPDEAGA